MNWDTSYIPKKQTELMEMASLDKRAAVVDGELYIEEETTKRFLSWILKQPLVGVDIYRDWIPLLIEKMETPGDALLLMDFFVALDSIEEEPPGESVVIPFNP